LKENSETNTVKLFERLWWCSRSTWFWQYSQNHSQVCYYQAKNKEKSLESNSMLTVMLQCKSTDPNSDDAFVRSVVALEPMAVLATKRYGMLLD